MMGADYYYTTDRGPGSKSSFGADFRQVKAVEVEGKGIPMTYLQLDSYWCTPPTPPRVVRRNSPGRLTALTNTNARRL